MRLPQPAAGVREAAERLGGAPVLAVSGLKKYFPVQRGMLAHDRARTRMFRVVEFIGRWSMLDVFVDTFVVALVQLSPLMSVQPGPGVVYFMAVVVLTMFAAHSFDSRLIWDRGVTTPTLATTTNASLAAPRGGAAGPRGGPSDLREDRGS